MVGALQWFQPRRFHPELEPVGISADRHHQARSRWVKLPIHGTTNGDSIQFGTVGATGITYKGTVSGNSMSGTYRLIGNGTTFSGPWNASRSS